MKLKQFFKVVSYLLIGVMVVESGPFVRPVTASDTTLGMLGGIPIEDVTPAPDPGNPEGQQPPPNNQPKDCNTDPVLINSGEFTENFTDIVFPSRGMNVEISRNYRSQSSINNRYGFGWYFNFYMRLMKLSNGNMLLIDGETSRKVEFIPTGGQYVSPDGVYQLLVDNGNGTHTLTEASGTRYEFDIDGKLTATRDRNNNQISFTYDPTGLLPISGESEFMVSTGSILLAYDYKLITITDTVGRDIHLSYNADGRLETITDYAGRVWTYNYLNDNLKSVQFPSTAEYPSGVVQQYTYDADHNLETITNKRGEVFVVNHYNADDKVEAQEYCGGTANLSYDTTNLITTVTDRKGFVTKWIYDNNGHIIQKEDLTAGLRAGEPASFITSFAYNSGGEMTTITYPRGNGVEFIYDSGNADRRKRGNLLSIRRKASAINNSNDLVTTITYESQFNQVKTVIDPKGNIYTNYFDYELPVSDPRYATKGNLIKIEQPVVDGPIPTTNLYYNAYGQITKVIDPNNTVVEYDYFPATGNLKEIRQDPLGINAVTQLTYDASNNLDTIIDANNHLTDLDFNALDWLTQEKNPLNFLTKYFHDEDGNVKRVERQANVAASAWQVTQLTYTKFNRIETITDPLSRQTVFDYDLSQNLKSVLDAENNLTQYQYDERDLLFKVIDANSPAGVTQYDYDANGNLVKITDAKAQPTVYLFDLFDRLQRTTYADARFEELFYDKNDNVLRVATPSTKLIEYDYDPLNRLVAKRFPLNASLNATYVYDPGSRLTDANVTGALIHYVYDNLNRVDNFTQMIGGTARLIDYDYFNNGLRKKLIYPSGKTVDYTYDANDRPDLVKVGGVNLVDYNFDTLDRRDTKSFVASLLPTALYSFDIANQLSTLTNKLVNSTPISLYNYPLYDNVGNRKTLNRTLLANPVEATNYNYNDIYELTQVTGVQSHAYDYDAVHNRQVADGVNYATNSLNQYFFVDSTVLSYDSNANLTSDGTNTYIYDEENRLTSAFIPGHSSSYKYDAFNRHISKTVDGVTTYFIHDNDEIIADYSSAGTLLAEYVWGADLDELLRMDRGANFYYYHSDGLGSVTEITDATGVLVEYYKYDPYGKIAMFNGSGTPLTNSGISNRYTFTGRELDAETGLYHYRARMYDAKLGRFLQRDPIGYYDSMNLYGYVGNNPINWVDPEGLLMMPMPYDPRVDDLPKQNYDDGMDDLNNPGFCARSDKPIIRPREWSTFDQLSWGLGGVLGVGGKLGQLTDWIRFGPTRVPNQIIGGKGAQGYTKIWSIKGGGTNSKTGYKLPFHYHIHKYNWYKPWEWFKYTPTL